MADSYSPPVRATYQRWYRQRDRLAVMRQRASWGLCPICGETEQDALRKAELQLESDAIAFEIAKLREEPSIGGIEAVVKRLTDLANKQRGLVEKLEADTAKLKAAIGEKTPT